MALFISILDSRITVSERLRFLLWDQPRGWKTPSVLISVSPSARPSVQPFARPFLGASVGSSVRSSVRPSVRSFTRLLTIRVFARPSARTPVACVPQTIPWLLKSGRLAINLCSKDF